MIYTSLKNKLVLILGMHRSGTSCLSGMLRQRGLYLGEEVSEFNRNNRKGNMELVMARSINNKLIKSAGGTWFDPRLIDEADTVVEQRIQEVKSYLFENHTTVGIKDPRMMWCLDLWMDDTVEIVGTIRHPELVRRSLAARNQMRAKKVEADWFEVWYAYNSRLLEIHSERPFPMVDFSWEERRYVECVNRISASLGLAAEGEGFFDSDLRHIADIDLKVPSKYMRLYHQLQERCSCEGPTKKEEGDGG